MFCPNCGADNRSEQNYCRSCGLKLDSIAKSVAEQFPSAEYAALQKRQDRFVKMSLGSLAATGAIGLGMILSLVGYYKLLLFGPEVLFWSSFGAFALFALLSVFFFTFPKISTKFEKVKSRPALHDDGGVVPTNKLIDERPFESVGSVTEHSTELLHSARESRKW